MADKSNSLGLLSPISPLSPFLLTSPVAMATLLKSSTNDTIKTSDITTPSQPLHNSDRSLQTNSLSPQPDYFEQYLSDTFSTLDKQELTLDPSFLRSKWRGERVSDDRMEQQTGGAALFKDTSINVQDNDLFSYISGVNNATINAPDQVPSLSSSVSSQSALKKSPNFSAAPDSAVQSPSPTVHNTSGSFQITPMPPTSPLPFIASKALPGNSDNHRHKESTSTFSSEFSEKKSIFSHATRASTASSFTNGHSRQSSKSKSFDANVSMAPVSFKPINYDKLSKFKTISKPSDHLDELPSDSNRLPELIEVNSANDVSANLAPPDALDIFLEPRSAVQPQLPAISSNIKEMDQRGLMITTSAPVLPPRSRLRAASVDKASSPLNTNGSIDAPIRSESVSPRSHISGTFSVTTPTSTAASSPSSKSIRSRKNSKSSTKESLSYNLNKELPKLPSEAITPVSTAPASRKNSDGKRRAPPLPLAKNTKNGETSRSPSIYDWECINNNLDLINMSIVKWDQIQNKTAETGTKAVRSYSHSASSSSDFTAQKSVSSGSGAPSLGDGPTKPGKTAPQRAIDISSMERSIPAYKSAQLMRKQSLKGYDLTAQRGKSRHLRQKSNPVETPGQFVGNLNFLAPPPPIQDSTVVFGLHKKSASTASSPTSIYTTEIQQPSAYAHVPGIGELASGQGRPTTALHPSSRSMSVPAIPLDQRQALARFKQDYEAKFSCPTEDVEEETLLPALPGLHTMNSSASSSTSSLHKKISTSSQRSFMQQETLPFNRLYTMSEKDSKRAIHQLARNAVDAAVNPRESFSTSLTEAIFMPEPSKISTTPPGSPRKGFSPPLKTPTSTNDSKASFNDHMRSISNSTTVSFKVTQPLKLRSKSISTAPQDPERFQEALAAATSRPGRSFRAESDATNISHNARYVKERSMSVGGSNHYRQAHSPHHMNGYFSQRDTPAAQPNSLRKPGSFGNLRNPFASSKPSNSYSEGMPGNYPHNTLRSSSSINDLRAYQVRTNTHTGCSTASNLVSANVTPPQPSSANPRTGSPSPFSSPHAPAFYSTYSGSNSNLPLNSRSASQSPSPSNGLYGFEPSVNTASTSFNSVTAISGNTSELYSSPPLSHAMTANGTPRWRWKKPSLSMGKR